MSLTYYDSIQRSLPAIVVPQCEAVRGGRERQAAAASHIVAAIRRLLCRLCTFICG